jgi:hypothetical protein
MVMTTVMHRRMPGSTSGPWTMARRLAGPGILAGLLGGLAMIVVMILVMGASGMGYATPLNIGMAAFVITITPPLSMLPTLMPLTGMHLPAATVTQMGALMSGHASNADVASLMSMMTPSARATVMSAMPVSAGQVVTGTILHFAYAGFLGVLFAVIIAAAMMMRVPFMRTAGGVIAAGVTGGALLYVIMRWGLLPETNPLMAFVPQTAFFLAHLLFGLVAGVTLAVASRRGGMLGTQARAGR